MSQPPTPSSEPRGFVIERGNDLVAVPTDGSDKRFDFSALSATQLDTYLKFFKDNGLNKFAGGFAPRNEFFQPWQNRLDLRVVPAAG